MRKEIFEQPHAVADTLLGRTNELGEIVLDEIRISPEELRSINKIVIVACGTAFYAGLVAKYAIEHWTRIPCEVELASEFRYRDPIIDPTTLVVTISQSGETADTLMAIRHAREQHAKVVAICNTNGATIPRESDAVRRDVVAVFGARARACRSPGAGCRRTGGRRATREPRTAEERRRHENGARRGRGGSGGSGKQQRLGAAAVGNPENQRGQGGGAGAAGRENREGWRAGVAEHENPAKWRAVGAREPGGLKPGGRKPGAGRTRGRKSPVPQVRAGGPGICAPTAEPSTASVRYWRPWRGWTP